MGESLRSLIATVGTPLLAAEEIGTRAEGDRRRAYRLRFADGSTLKGRRYPSIERAAVVWRIHQGDAARLLARAVAHDGDAMLEDWVAGESLATAPVSERHLQEAGRMLGALHTCPVPSVADLSFEPFDVQVWARKTVESVDILQRRALLSLGHAEALSAIATSERPADVPAGIVHRDLCPTNLLVTTGGRLVSVDNGTMTIGSRDHDLCRVWYRWPMTANERAAFNAGYGEHRASGLPDRPSRFWATVVIVNSARTRLALSEASAAAALMRLDEVGLPRATASGFTAR
jgi:aminoglycoside phosphotransferase (APT) family kinase protein